MAYQAHHNHHRYSLDTKTIINGYAGMVKGYMDEGWQGFIVTMMFSHIQGSMQNVAKQMENEVFRVYATSLTRIVRKPTSDTTVGKRPIWMICPDYPVPKHEKKSVAEVSINEGRHNQGIALIPPRSRLHGGLDRHFVESRALYVRPPHPLMRLHAEPITRSPEKAVRYVLKAIKNGRATYDDLIIMPRSGSELERD